MGEIGLNGEFVCEMCGKIKKGKCYGQSTRIKLFKRFLMPDDWRITEAGTICPKCFPRFEKITATLTDKSQASLFKVLIAGGFIKCLDCEQRKFEDDEPNDY